MTNYEIADHFTLLSKLMDIHGENSFKAKSYSSAAFTIEKLPRELSAMTRDEMDQVRGIGDAIQAKIDELLQSGKLSALEQMLAQTPPGILEIMEIKGLGPKKIATIWKEMGIESIGELEYACHENRLATIKGFGAKTQQNVADSIAFLRKNQGWHLWAEVENTAIQLAERLRQALPGHRFELTGDIRRQNETLEQIEIATDAAPEALQAQFSNIPDVVAEEEPNGMLVIRVPQQPTIRFYTADADNFYTTLFHSSGSPAFLSAFLDKYSVPEHAADESDIFSHNKLQFIPPALRETETILDKAAAGTLSTLITASDIKGIIHSHSTWSDGVHTLEQMATAARDQGFEYLVISDHSQIAFYANGLSPERIVEQHKEVDALNQKLAPFRIFKSIEADILNDGRLDYDDAVLGSFDLVIASVHSNLKMSLDKAMDRLLAAIRNPHTTILGHMTGRLLLSREGYPVDHKRVIDACAEHRVVIEINAHPRRLDIDWRWIDYALDKGVLLSIDPDAHAIEGFKDVYYGAMIGQKGGLTAKSNLSSFSLPEFEAFLQQRKK